MNLQTANGGLERLRQLNELLAREEKVDAVYRHLWSATDLGVALVADEGQFLDCNEAYAQILGRKINDVLGETWQSMTPEPDRSIDQAKVDACLRGESEGYFLLKRYEILGGQVAPGFGRAYCSLHLSICPTCFFSSSKLIGTHTTKKYRNLLPTQTGRTEIMLYEYLPVPSI